MAEARARSESEKAVTFVMVLFFGLVFGTLGERLTFVANSRPAQAEITSEYVDEVELTGTLSRPQGQTITSDRYSVSFRDEAGKYGYDLDLSYFFAPPTTGSFPVRVRSGGELGDEARRAGFDLFAVPVLCLLPLLGLELLRRKVATKVRA
ncbi:MAG: hypothetical protein KC457_33690 [Myxococcales bacterium]|nr:hypothetical protein [Myxococcales bacterium]